MSVLVVCGLKAEAAIATGPGVRCVVGGGRADLLRQRLEAAVAQARPSGVLSFGIAGALAPALRSGEMRAASAVRHGPDRYEADPPWREALMRRLKLGEAVIASSDTVVATRRDKAALRDATGADLVDMESGVAAAFAHAHRLPFAALRAVSDDARSALPRSVGTAMTPDGGVRVSAVLTNAIVRPQDWWPLIRAGGDAARAFRALEGSWASAGEALPPPT